MPKGVLTNAGWNGIFTIWSIGIGFLLTPLLIHFLGIAHYGILLIIWSVTGILGIMNFGLGEATLRYVALHYGDNDLQGVNRVFGATLSFYTAISSLVIIGMAFAAPTLATYLKIPAGEHRLVCTLLRLSAFVFALGIITRAYGAIPMALHRYDVASKLNIVQSLMRSVGYVVLVVLKFGILSLVLWDAFMFGLVLLAQAAVIRRLAPGVRLFPSFSFQGLRDTMGYSVFSMMTYCFYTMFRESGKLVLGRYAGTSPVAYLGTPDNVSQRLHQVVSGSCETLLPRFSASKDSRAAASLFFGGTWGALVASIVIFIPVTVLMPDFLRLWINPDFARESAAAGQVVAISYIVQGAFAPAATFFRGTGKPWFVTIVLLAAGVVTLLSGVLLVPAHGAFGAGVAYLLGSMAHLLGLLVTWFYVLGRGSGARLVRSVCMPVLLGALTLVGESAILARFADVGWGELIMLAALFALLTGSAILLADWVLGGPEPPSRELWGRMVDSPKLQFLRSFAAGFRRWLASSTRD